MWVMWVQVCEAFNKRYMHSVLRARVWRGLRVEYRLCLGLDGARGVWFMV
jgi:hypothetical protein